MFRLLRPDVSSRKPARAVLTLTPQNRLYFPGRGLGYSFIFHGIALTLLLSLPIHNAKKPYRPWDTEQQVAEDRDDGDEGRFVMYLPSLGGGGQSEGGGPESSGGEPAKAASTGTEGLVFPGPQLIRSDPPQPTNQFQTLIQPELEDLPTLTQPVDLPNLLAMPDVGLVPPSPSTDPDVAPTDTVDPPVDPEPAEESPAPEPVQPEIEDLPIPTRPLEPSNLFAMPDVGLVAPSPPEDLAVGLGDPDKPEEQQPLELSDGAAIEPLQLAVEDLPIPTQTLDLPQLLPMADVGVARPVLPADPEVGPPEADVPEQAPAPIDVSELVGLARLPSPGTDLNSILALTPMPTLDGQPVEIPAGEAQGRFTISPEANLDTSETEPGLPSDEPLDPETVGSAGENSIDENLPSAVTITFGAGAGTGEGGTSTGDATDAMPGSGSGSASGPGVGSGPGSGAGSGSGSGSGPGSGGGSGPGSGPFAGITIVGGVGGTETFGSGPDSGSGPLSGITIIGGVGGTGGSGSGTGSRGDDPLGGITIVGGVEETEDSGDPFPVIRVPRPLQDKYGVFVVSTENSGGGLPFVGVFSDEQIRTVYLDMRQRQTDSGPFWPLEFAVPSEGATKTIPDGELDEPGFVLPAPTVKRAPELPLELIRSHLRKMIIVYAVINVEGKLEQMVVQESPDSRLNQPVLEALSQWVFRPGALDGIPTAVQTLVGIPLWLPDVSR